jgi:hypothetical protein
MRALSLPSKLTNTGAVQYPVSTNVQLLAREKVSWHVRCVGKERRVSRTQHHRRSGRRIDTLHLNNGIEVRPCEERGRTSINENKRSPQYQQKPRQGQSVHRNTEIADFPFLFILYEAISLHSEVQRLIFRAIGSARCRKVDADRQPSLVVTSQAITFEIDMNGKKMAWQGASTYGSVKVLPVSAVLAGHAA